MSVILSVPTISCAGCVGKIERALSSTKGVTTSVVNLADKTVRIDGDVPTTELIAAVAAVGFPATEVVDEHESRRQQQLRDQAKLTKLKYQTIVALTISLPLMGWMMVDDHAMAISTTSQSFWGVIGLLTLAVMVFSGGHYYRGFWQSLQVGSANMDTLIALGTGSAWLYSMVVVLFPTLIPFEARHVYFEASAMIIGLINFGQILELKSKGRTGAALNRLLKLQTPTARRVTNNGDEEVAVEHIEHGDHLRIVPGSSIPVDGIVIQGETLVDESMLTGEPMPVNKRIGDTMSAGTINRNGSVVIEATRVGRETALARIISLVRQAQSTKMPIARLADKIAAVFVPTVIVIALTAATIWYMTGPAPTLTYALTILVTVLIIACPCALGLATPMSMMVGIGKAAELGILIRKGEALQTASTLTMIILDKTGTITEGRPKVTAITAYDHTDDRRLLSLAAALEQHSEHPLADAIIVAAKERQLPKQPVDDFTAVTGRGVCGMIDSQRILFGNERLLTENNVNIDAYRDEKDHLSRGGQTVILLAINGQLAGAISVSDPVRADSAEAITRLHRLGLKVVMLTGDNLETAKTVATQTGLDSYCAEMLPEDKERYVRELQEHGEIVGMTGDGINDAPALARANVGFAIGTGTDIAIETADITLMRGSLNGLADSIELSRAALKNIRQNLFGAFVYNTLGIPVAAGVLYPLTGLLLNPIVAGAAMALSSVTVVSNANRLRLFQPSSNRSL